MTNEKTNKLLHVLVLIILILGATVFLMLLAAGFVEAYLGLSRIFGLQHALGIDTQSSKNYDFTSGPGPMFVAALGFSSLAAGLVKHINCEKRGCWRWGHAHPGHGRPVCGKHYHHDVTPDLPSGP